MDYQTFNSQQHHLPSSLGGPFSTSLPGTSVSAAHYAQPTHSPQQQQQVYADPQARFQQSSPSSFPYSTNGQAGGFPLASSMGGGTVTSSNNAMMQPGNLSQHQLHSARAALHQQQQSPSPYSSAPFSQGLSSPAVSAAQKFGQYHKAASPSNSSNHISPYATPQAQQQSPHLTPSHHQQPQNQHSMAAPPTTQPMQTQTQTPVKAVPRSPVSPGAQAREKERMTVLLEINNVLLMEVVDLQTQGKAGHVGQAVPPVKEDGKPDTDKQQPAKEYVECMRRLQCNLAYLAQNAEKNHKPNQPIQPGPAIMTIPQSPPQLVELYIKLQGLYPGWKGQQKASPGPQRPNPMQQQQAMSAGMQNNTMQPPNSAGLPQNMQQNVQQPNSVAQNNLQQATS
ncbi:hypothetical protein K469DRAFT_698908 [Zopfia rhizophila CBS 207.26]|uniref:Uncharacterized protein n=1 Tax=Zopfia rhizophila CBS 207.26 TaxID=1314779 RepID=A0A6A6EWE3_9PEZI|nr:hypothetical protein K469DRAFT_698908 [Zopfia rhizophila CBS 207.26]